MTQCNKQLLGFLLFSLVLIYPQLSSKSSNKKNNSSNVENILFNNTIKTTKLDSIKLKIDSAEMLLITKAVKLKSLQDSLTHYAKQ